MIGVSVYMSFLCKMFDLWSILYSTMVTVHWDLAKKSRRDFYEPDSYANQYMLGSSIIKHAWSRGADPTHILF